MISFKGLWATATGSKVGRVVACLEENIHEGWTNDRLPGALEKLADEGVLDDPQSVAALAACADVALVARQIRSRASAISVPALAPFVLDSSPLREQARPAVEALFARAVLVDPHSLAGVPAEVQSVGEKLLSEAGRGLPPAAWNSPWEAAAAKKKPKKLEAPPLVAWDERFHLDAAAVAPGLDPGPTIDRELEARWVIGEHVVNPVYLLNQMSVPTALRLWNQTRPNQVMVWGDELARLIPRLGLAGLEASLAAVATHPSGLEGLSALESPRAAPVMATALAGRPAQRAIARAWFDRFPEAAAVGLVPGALEKDRTQVVRAVEALRHLGRIRPEAVTQALGRYPPPVREAVEELVARGPDLPSKRPALPDFADPRGLPWPLTADRSSLQGDALSDLVRLLKLTPLDGAPWITDLRAAFTHDSLVRLAQALFAGWLVDGAPPRERWALQALAHFPDDAVAEQLALLAAELAPRISSRAQEIVEVLAAMQTRVSLKRVHLLSRKVRSKAFRARAELAFTTAAEKMGLSEDELAERLVPDYGLSPEGVLPVQPRIRITVGKGLKLGFVAEDGAPVKSLPATGDEELDAQLGELKKRGNGLLKEIAERLEQRMANGRAMPLEHFTEVYLMHGLARRIAEGVVWIQGARTFALGSQGAIDDQGQPFVPLEGVAVGVAHPLQLPAEVRARWATRLGPQPFAQLDRRAQTIASVEALRSAVSPYFNRTVPVGSVLKLEKLGWQRGEVVGGGCYVSYVRGLPTGQVEVDFNPGIYLGDPMMHADQVIEGIEVRLRDPTPAVLLSEIERELHLVLQP